MKVNVSAQAKLMYFIIQVYRMTASRGRVLIINIRDDQSEDSSERREGSEHDYKNLTKMFKKFGFIISELSGDKSWEAKVRHWSLIIGFKAFLSGLNLFRTYWSSQFNPP